MAEKILIGADINNPLYTFTNATIRSCACVLSSSMVVDELAIDQFMPVVYSASYIRVAFAPKGTVGLRTADGKRFMVYPGTGFLDELPYGTPIWYYSDDVLIGKFYSQRIVRRTKTFFGVLAVSAIGILDGQRHNGGIYTGETFRTVAADIIGSGFAFSCAEDVEGIRIYGWLPVDSCRENLHQLLFACGVNLVKDDTGALYFRFPDVETVTNVPDNRIFLGGSVDYMSPATRVEVTEHIFEALSTDETVVLYDNTQGGEVAVEDYIVFRQAPVHDLTTTGNLTIHESGVNYAIVSGSGTLTGQTYTHITRVLSRETGADGENKTVSVTEATLVNVANSENVAQRMISYYGSVRTIHSEIILNGERPGDQISFNNPYNEPERAFLASMDMNASSFIRASCELVTGYLPSGAGNNYSQVVVLTGGGEWTVPDTIPVNAQGFGKIRVAIMQAGSGGHGGYMGTDGESVNKPYTLEENFQNLLVEASQNVGNGGLPGTPGSAGKVLVLTLQVHRGQKFSFSCGSPGIGGAGQTEEADAQPGSEGGETTFGTYTSADGAVVESGYLDIINGVLYAIGGENGTEGERGHAGADTTVGYGNGPLGGSPATGTWILEYYYGTLAETPWKCGGGGQGGNAYGAVGEAGETQVDTYAEDFANKQTSAKFLTGSKGGNGATPKTPQAPATLGSGGHAGHGGGGGGTGGTFHCTPPSVLLSSSGRIPGGKKGLGGKGGDGAPGGIIIYL